MDSQLFAATVGAVVGAGAAIGGTVAIDLRKERKQARAAREMLKIEIERNVWAVRRLDKSMPERKGGSDEETDEERADRLRRMATESAKALIAYPLGSWSVTTWTTQNALWPSIMPVSSIKEIADLYDSFEALSTLRSELIAAQAADDEDGRSPRNAVVQFVGLPWHFAHLVSDIDPPIYSLVSSIIDQGTEIEQDFGLY